MTELERKRTEVELLRVQSAKAELEFKIMEREEDILRIREHIEVQIKRENELAEKLS